MRFIRAYWGNLDAFNGRHKDEIIATSKIEGFNSFVYVWGKENYEFIKAHGFNCKYVEEFNVDYVDNSNIFMLPKLWAIRAAIQTFGEVVFLDWDCVQLKPVDDEFWNLLRSRKPIQMPLYSYPIDYVDQVLFSWTDISNKEHTYILKQEIELKKYHYLWKDNYVTPNAGFIYCRSLSAIIELLEFITLRSIRIAIEEMGFVIFTKRFCTTLEEYAAIYEPLVCSGKTNDHFNQKQLNDFLLPDKNLYFQHI